MREKELTLENLDVRIEMPDVPVVWLDTSVLIKLTRHWMGKGVDPAISGFADAIEGAAQRGAVRVVASEQEEELVRESWREFRQTVLRLSGNSMYQHQLDVMAYELQQFMVGWARGDKTVRLERTRIFNRAAIDAGREQDVISVEWGDEEKRRSERRTFSYRQGEQVEAIRQGHIARRTKFQDHLERELIGWLTAADRIQTEAREAMGKGALSADVLDKLELAGDLQSAWEEGKKFNPKLGTPYEFFTSPYGRAMPTNWVRAILWTDLVLGTEEVAGSDSEDVDFLTFVLPFSDYMVVDKRMAARAEKHGLHERFKCRLLRERDLISFAGDLKSWS